MANTVKITIQAIDRATATLANISKKMATIGALGIGAAVGVANQWASVEKKLGAAGAMAGWTAGEFEKMKAVALDVGKNTALTFGEASDGMYAFASAGIDVTKNMEAYNNILNLAVGASGDFAETANVVTSIMTQFGIVAKDSAAVVDGLAYAVSTSKTDMLSLGEAYKQVGPIAAEFGQSINTVNAGLIILAQQGLKGAAAGTAFRNVLLRLAAPSAEATKTFNALGVSIETLNSSVDFTDILEELEKVNMSAADVKAIFGEEALVAFLSFKKAGADAFRGIADAAENATGKAKAMADYINKLDWVTLQNMMETITGLAMEFGPAIVTALSNMFEPLKKAIDGFETFEGQVKAVQTVLASFAGLAFLGFLGSAASAVLVLTNVVIGLSAAMIGFAVAAGPVTWILIAIVAAANALGLVIANTLPKDPFASFDGSAESLEKVNASLKKLNDIVPKTKEYMEDLAKSYAEANDMSETAALNLVVSGTVEPDFVVDFDSANETKTELIQSYNLWTAEVKKEFGLQGNAVINLEALAENEEAFTGKMENVSAAVSEAMSKIAKDTKEAADIVKVETKSVKQAIDEMFSIQDSEGGPIDGPFSSLKESMEKDIKSIQLFLETDAFDVNKYGIDIKGMGAKLNGIFTDEFKADAVKNALKTSIASLAQTIVESGSEIPDNLDVLGNEIDEKWWDITKGGLLGEGVDMTKAVDDVKQGANKIKVDLNNLQDLTRRNLTTPEIRVVGSNITKHKVEVILNLNKEEFLKQWNKLGFNMTSGLENSLLYG